MKIKNTLLLLISMCISTSLFSQYSFKGFKKNETQIYNYIGFWFNPEIDTTEFQGWVEQKTRIVYNVGKNKDVIVYLDGKKHVFKNTKTKRISGISEYNRKFQQLRFIETVKNENVEEAIIFVFENDMTIIAFKGVSIYFSKTI